MTLYQILLVTFTVFLLSVGQILFKIVSADMDFTFAGIIAAFLSLKLFAAFLVYVFATILWMFVLKSVALKMAYPFAALAFFIVPILAHFFLDETLSWHTYLGAFFIAVGVVISVL